MKPSEALRSTLKKEIPFLKEDKFPEGFNETVDLMFDNEILLDRERFNILTSYWNLPPTNLPFFNHYFEKQITTIDQFLNGLDKFIKEALWHFGDLERAYVTLCEVEDINDYFSEHRFHVDELTGRLPWKLIEEIEPKDRGFLGYVSGQRPKQQQVLIGIAEQVISEIEDNSHEYKDLNKNEITEKVLLKISKSVPDIKIKIEEIKSLTSDLNKIDLFSAPQLENAKKFISLFKSEIEATILKIEKLKEIGRRNQEHYLRNIESIDVYVATSMRNDEEYLDMYNFVNSTFNDENISTLNLRYFDPTLCFCESRIDKGIIECLLVRSSKVTIYCAQEGDTFGKDSELAATMAQGKPVIVYVPIPKLTDPDIASEMNLEIRQTKLDIKIKKMDSRAKIFTEFHPLGLQVGLYDGVARGVIVVRTPVECSKVLYKILTNTLDVIVSYEQNGLVLREKETNSIVRVMSGWGVLANCFWNQFSKTQNPKSGLLK